MPLSRTYVSNTPNNFFSIYLILDAFPHIHRAELSLRDSLPVSFRPLFAPWEHVAIWFNLTGLVCETHSCMTTAYLWTSVIIANSSTRPSSKLVWFTRLFRSYFVPFCAKRVRQSAAAKSKAISPRFVKYNKVFSIYLSITFFLFIPAQRFAPLVLLRAM